VRTGRPKKSNDGLTVDLWLKAFLSGGRRKANDILRYGKLQGFSPKTLRRAKDQFGIDSEQENRVWYWSDPAVQEQKPETESKLDVLVHKVDELARLSQAPIPVPTPAVTKPGPFATGTGRPYNPDDPVQIALRARLQRHADIQEIVTSADPFGLLESATADEIEQMLTRVRNHRADLDARSRKIKYVQGEFEEEKESVDADGNVTKFTVKTAGLRADGFEAGEDVTVEAAKWDTWVARAKGRLKQIRLAATA
jgi:hypothetical protein